MNLQVGVKIILANSENRVLLLRRAQMVSHGGEQVWDIPGGRIEPNEALLPALQREVKEETGLKLENQPKLLAAQDIFVEAKNLHVVRLTYMGQASGEIALSGEHDEYNWMNIDEVLSISNLDLYLKEVVETL